MTASNQKIHTITGLVVVVVLILIVVNFVVSSTTATGSNVPVPLRPTVYVVCNGTAGQCTMASKDTPGATSDPIQCQLDCGKIGCVWTQTDGYSGECTKPGQPMNDSARFTSEATCTTACTDAETVTKGYGMCTADGFSRCKCVWDGTTCTLEPGCEPDKNPGDCKKWCCCVDGRVTSSYSFEAPSPGCQAANADGTCPAFPNCKPTRGEATYYMNDGSTCQVSTTAVPPAGQWSVDSFSECEGTVNSWYTYANGAYSDFADKGLLPNTYYCYNKISATKPTDVPAAYQHPGAITSWSTSVTTGCPQVGGLSLTNLRSGWCCSGSSDENCDTCGDPDKTQGVCTVKTLATECGPAQPLESDSQTCMKKCCIYGTYTLPGEASALPYCFPGPPGCLCANPSTGFGATGCAANQAKVGDQCIDYCETCGGEKDTSCGFGVAQKCTSCASPSSGEPYASICVVGGSDAGSCVCRSMPSTACLQNKSFTVTCDGSTPCSSPGCVGCTLEASSDPTLPCSANFGNNNKSLCTYARSIEPDLLVCPDGSDCKLGDGEFYAHMAARNDPAINRAIQLGNFKTCVNNPATACVAASTVLPNCNPTHTTNCCKFYNKLNIDYAAPGDSLSPCTCCVLDPTGQLLTHAGCTNTSCQDCASVSKDLSLSFLQAV